jgi:hypothetical protein
MGRSRGICNDAEWIRGDGSVGYRGLNIDFDMQAIKV